MTHPPPGRGGGGGGGGGSHVIEVKRPDAVQLHLPVDFLYIKDQPEFISIQFRNCRNAELETNLQFRPIPDSGLRNEMMFTSCNPTSASIFTLIHFNSGLRIPEFLDSGIGHYQSSLNFECRNCNLFEEIFIEISILRSFFRDFSRFFRDFRGFFRDSLGILFKDA